MHKPYPLQKHRDNPQAVAMEDKSPALPISEDLSRKIVSLAAGEAHTIALTGKKKKKSSVASFSR